MIFRIFTVITIVLKSFHFSLLMNGVIESLASLTTLSLSFSLSRPFLSLSHPSPPFLLSLVSSPAVNFVERACAREVCSSRGITYLMYPRCVVAARTDVAIVKNVNAIS